jgi:hypothetical protein
MTKWLYWVLPVIALLMVGLTLAPAEVWRAPAADAVYVGFDPNLQYATAGSGGTAKVSRDVVDLTTGPVSQSTVDLATTPLRKLNAAIDVVVANNESDATVLRLGMWSPWTSTGYFVDFGPAPANTIKADVVIKGTIAANLVGGQVISSSPLGKYRLGAPYRVEFLMDRTAGSITTSVSSSDGTLGQAKVNSQQFPAIFGNVPVSLSASAISAGPPITATLRNFVLTLPHERLWASKASDPIATTALIVLALAGALLILVAVVAALWRAGPAFLNLRRPHWGGRSWLVLLLAICAAGVYLAGNALLLPLKGHPFDFGNEELYAYVAKAFGPQHLYYLPNVVSLATIWGGIPYLENAFPYEPVMAYLSAGVGWITSARFAGGGLFALDSWQVAYVIKAVNVLFGLGDGALIYLILREIKVARSWSLIASALFLFNPAVWFSMSVWGQTHVVSLFFVLAAVLLAEKHLPFWAWLALAAGCLTRPQMLVFGLVLGIAFLRKFSWKENLTAVSWTVIVSFISWIPFTLATSPSLPVDILLNNFHVQEAGGNQAALTTVSQDAYSLWPLVTFIAHGASGLQRAFTASSTPLFGSVTYQQVSQVATLSALLVISAVLLFRKRTQLESGAYIPFVALGMTSFLMLLTGLVATHFLLALPFLILCRRWMGTLPWLLVVAIWTVTTLVPMFGEMSLLVPHQQYPFVGASSALRQFFIQLNTSDRFITGAVVANLCAVVWLAILTIRPAAPPTRPGAVA